MKFFNQNANNLNLMFSMFFVLQAEKNILILSLNLPFSDVEPNWKFYIKSNVFTYNTYDLVHSVQKKNYCPKYDIILNGIL